MNSIFRGLILNKKFVLNGNFVLFSTNRSSRQVQRPVLRKQPTTSNRIEPFGWFMLVIPVASFGLGVWQIRRKFWKEKLIADLTERTGSAPIGLPENLDEVKNLEFRPVLVRGTFLHDKEIYMGPRAMVDKEDRPKPAFGDLSTQQGYLVITPFKLADRDLTILVNRGWVATNNVKPTTRTEGQVEGIVAVIGILRLNENRRNFAMKNQEGSNLYFYRDLEAMCNATGASPIFLDQTIDYNVPVGPVGGQTRVTLRNEHLSYIITWFSLSAATSVMWFKKYVKRR